MAQNHRICKELSPHWIVAGHDHSTDHIVGLKPLVLCDKNTKHILTHSNKHMAMQEYKYKPIQTFQPHIRDQTKIRCQRQ